MKRNFSYSNQTVKTVLKICFCFLVSFAVMLALLAIETLIHLKYNFSDMTVKILSIIILLIGVSVCSSLITIFAKTKGYIGGLISGGAFCVIKALFTLIKDEVRGVNFLTYLALICCGLLFGIITAGRKYRKKW